MRVTSKGQVTIPRDLRELAGIETNSEVVFSIEDGKITIRPKHGVQEAEDRDRLAALLLALDELEGTGDPDMRAADVMAMTRDR